MVIKMIEFDKADEQKLLQRVTKKVLNDEFQRALCNELLRENVKESYENVTTQEIMNKVKDFIAQEPSEVNYEIFLKLLSYYPVSMCKREVSPLLRKLIGVLYRIGIHEPDEESSLDYKISYDDLAEIFCRSKATISDCIIKTEGEWQEVKQDVEREMEKDNYAVAEAKRQLIEEAKQKLTENNIEGINA